VNAILYIASTGCQWRQSPKEFPPYSTAQGHFYAWSRDGVFARVNHALVMASREKAGHEASPTTGGSSIASRQRPRKAVAARLRRRQENQGRKRHIVIDTQGNLVGLVAHEADIKDLDGAPRILDSIPALYPWLRHIFGDGGYAGDKLRAAPKGKGSWTLEIIIVPTSPVASRFCPAVGLPNGPSLGSDGVIVSQKTSKRPSTAPSHGSSSYTSAPSPDASKKFDAKLDHFESASKGEDRAAIAVGMACCSSGTML
jgi:transposase